MRNRYLWAPAVDLLLSDEKLTAPDEPGEIYWTLGDNLNTIRDIARYNPVTDVTTIVNHRVFDAFGNMTDESDPDVDLLFSFTGRLFDESTGLQNNLNRWYDPATGRWLSEDPIGFAPGDANLYRYVGNSPATQTDPSGTSAVLTCRAGGQVPGLPFQGSAFSIPIPVPSSKSTCGRVAWRRLRRHGPRYACPRCARACHPAGSQGRHAEADRLLEETAAR